jgi:hypothetical protein
MSHISAVVRLRPIRFAFIVRPDDKKRALQIFQTNTCLWGGKYNPIVPYFKQVPKWWDRNGHNFETAVQIINGYLDFFEPDFLVEAEPGLANGLGFDEERVLQLSDILARATARKSGHGLSVFDLYRDLYLKEFQFVQRHGHSIVDVSSDQPSFDGFVACVFGAFPSEKDRSYFGKAFADAFEPKGTKLTAETLEGLFESGFTSALRIGHSKLEVDYHDHSDPALFVLNADEPRDLIDFWNLRAIRRDILPVPLQWLDRLSAFCKGFITKNYRPLPGNDHGVMIRPTVMFSRSIPSADIEKLYLDYLRVDVEGANCRQDWYPSIWRPSPGITVRNTRPILSGGEKTFDTQFDTEKPSIRFDCLYPEFAEKYGSNNRWANVVRLRDWTHLDQVATVFPCDYRNPKFPNFSMVRDHLLPTTEGFVFFSEYKETQNLWQLADGTTTINSWLKTHGINATLSDAGRATQQIIQTLGGFWGVASFAHANIVKLLNKISRTPISPSVQHQKFKNEIENATKGDIWRHRNFETLVERGAVELGLKLKCTKCSSWSWYALPQLDYEVSCSLCLRRFKFPLIDPGSSKNSDWAYRLIGPFALPDYAKGGYAASLSIRFFADVIGTNHDSNVTWSAGQVLELGPKDKIEADLILWYQRKVMFGNDYQTDLIFGEAKSFRGENPEEKRAIKDAFQAEDIERMKRLAIRFPGAVLVFSTMKHASEFSKDESDRITKLAEWGREYVRERQQTRAPVIVLTSTELFAPHSLRETWRTIGGKHAEFANAGWTRLDNLRVLADLTQQLYLAMPAYGTWLEEKWEKKAAKRQQRKAAIQAPPPENP